MRAANPELPDSQTRGAGLKRFAARFKACALIAFCALLAACGQRGPLYYPVLPPVNAADSRVQAPPMLHNLPTPQTRLLDGSPSTMIAAPQVSLPQAGESTMPVATQAAPANTPAAGTSNGSSLNTNTAPLPVDPAQAAPADNATPQAADGANAATGVTGKP